MTITLYGDNGYCGMAKQTLQGTGVAPTRFFKPISLTFVPVQKVTDYRNGNQRDLNFALKEEFIYKGQLKTFLFADEGMALLAWCMGKDTKTGAGDPYTHTLDLTVDALPYITIEVGYFNSQILDRVIDCKIAKLLIEFEAGKPAYITADLLGCSVAVQGSAATVSFNDGAGQGPALLYQGALTLTGPSDAVTLAGQVNKGSIELDQGIVPVYGPGQVYPLALFEEGRKVTVKITPYFSGPALHNFINYGASAGTGVSQNVTTGSLESKFTVQSGTEHSIDITAGYLNWHMSAPKYSPDAKVGLMEVMGMGYRAGSNYPLAVVGKNGVSTAYV